MDDFTGNQYWQPKPGSPIDPANHPATSIPDATEHHDGTELGYATLKSDMTRDAGNPWQRSMRGQAEGDTIAASKVFRKNNDK